MTTNQYPAVSTYHACCRAIGDHSRHCPDGLAAVFAEAATGHSVGTVHSALSSGVQNRTPAAPECADGGAELIVTASAPRPGELRDVMTAYADQLRAVDAFTGLDPADARVVAAVIAWEVLHGQEGRGLRARARVLRDGGWRWTDQPADVADAFTAAARILDSL